MKRSRIVAYSHEEYLRQVFDEMKLSLGDRMYVLSELKYDSPKEYESYNDWVRKVISRKHGSTMFI